MTNREMIKKKPKKFILPHPPKLYWVPCAPRIAIMRGNYGQSDLNFSSSSRSKQGSANVSVAIGYSSLKSAETWKPSDLDDILTIGDQLYRTTCVRNKFRIGTSFPPSCIHPTFYAGYHEINIFVDHNFVSGDLFKNSDDSLRNLQANIQTLSEKFMGLILVFGCRFLAFWKQNFKVYCFSPDDLELTNCTFSTNSFALRSNGYESILKFISKSLWGRYLIYGIRIAKIRQISDTLPDVIDKRLVRSTSLCLFKPEVDENNNRTEETLSKSKSNENKISKYTKNEVVFSSDYSTIGKDRGILCGSDFVKDLEKIVHANIAAAIILYHSRSYMWTSTTIGVILKLGERIYNSSKKNNITHRTEWQERVHTPIHFRQVYFNVTFKYTVYGTVTATDNNETDFGMGVKFFFKGSDVGIVMGPQMVLIWKEKGVYYMFDPKERDGIGRKWIRTLSKEVGGFTPSGAACVTWFKNSDSLAKLYISNIRDKYHRDGFRISSVKLTPV